MTALLLAVAFIIVAGRTSRYVPDSNQVVDYWLLITVFFPARVGFGLCVGFWVLLPVIAFSVWRRESGIAGITLIAMLLSGVLMCSVEFPGLNPSASYLEHRNTIQFDNHVYHLAIYHYNEGDIGETYNDLLLYECDLSDTQCRSRSIGVTFDPPSKAALLIDSVLNQLQVIIDDRVVFKLNPSTTAFPR